MKKYLAISFLMLSVIFLSCSKIDNVITPSESSGSITLAFDKASIPPNVTHVKVSLSREGFNTVQRMMDLTSDSTAELTINRLEVGEWFLQVAAFGISNDTLYKGETFVSIRDNYTTIVNLTLLPGSGNGYGNIIIYVTWGTFDVDLTHWQDTLGPILTGGQLYEQNGVFQPHVLFENGIYKMWYSGINNSALSHIYYATSTDGINWEKHQQAVLTPGQYGQWDSYSVGHPKVIKIGSTYQMYYRGESDTYGNWHIGLATSMDGINWTKHPNPILLATTGMQRQIIPNEVFYMNNKYYLFFSGSSNYRLQQEGEIFLATSTDGINFTKYNSPILTPTLPWEGTALGTATIIFDNNKFKAIYMDFTTNTKVGYAESYDGLSWNKKSEPIFDYTIYKDIWSRQIAQLCLVKVNNDYRLYTGSPIYNVQYYKIGCFTLVR